MATPLSASRLVAALKAEGCKVREYGDWRTHNRNHKGAWGPINGVMIHHTVTSGEMSSVRLCYNGHSSLPGPLCHSVGAKDGTVWMVGHGRANHAGLGDDEVMRDVIAERSLSADNEANTDGNSRFYGIELVNMGDGRDPWPDVQYDAAARWAAAICRAHGWGAASVIGHKEWQPGKIDPTFDMDNFRRRVAELLSHPAGAEEDDMPTAKEIADEVWNWDGVDPLHPTDSNPKHQAENVLTSLWKAIDQVRSDVGTLSAKVDALDLEGFKAAIESMTVTARLDVTE